MEPTPFMKAMHKWAMADPNDCDREWAACIAMVRERETASGSSPTTSTSPLHYRAPTAAVMASATTRSTALLRAPSSGVSTKDSHEPVAATSAPPTARSSAASVRAAEPTRVPAATPLDSAPATSRAVLCTKGDLSPEAQRLYGLLVDDSVAPASTASLHAPSCTAMDCLTPEARHIYDYLVGGATATAPAASEISTVLREPTAPNVAPVAVEINATDLSTTVPTSCSSECPSHEAAVPLSVIISSATQNSPTTTWGVLPELDTPSVSDKALDVDVVGDTSHADTICLPADLDDSTGEEEVLVDVSLTPESALASFVLPLVFESMAPNRCLVTCSVEGTCVLMPRFNCALLPWSSFKCSPFWTSLVRLKHGKIAWGHKRLRPPWPPPEREIFGCHTKEAARGSAHRLGTVGPIMLHPVGKHVTSGPCAKLCLDDVSCKLPRWWSDNQCVRPPNATIDVSSCSWFTSKHTKVQFQFPYPVFPVNCHFARMHFLLSRRAEMSVEFNCGTSLNLAVYGGYPALHMAHTRSWMWILVGYLMQYGPDAYALFLLIYWLLVPCLRLLLGLIHALQGCISSSPSVLLPSLNERAEIQQHHTCVRVLPVAGHKGKNYHYSLEGNPHYSVLAQCSFSHSLLQIEFLFYTPGHVFFCSCALVQWRIPWAINLFSVRSWFQYYYARSEFMCNIKNFQWTIAWFLCYHLSLSIAWLFSCPLLVKLVELKLWPSLSYQFSSSVSCTCSCQQLGDWLLPCSTQWVFLSSSEKFQWEIAGLPDLIEWKPRTSGVYLWESYQSASSCGSDVIFMWLQFVGTYHLSPKAELLSNITIELKPWPSWKLFPSSSAVPSCLRVAFHILASLVLLYSISSHYLEVYSLDAKLRTLIVLHAGKFFWLLGQHPSYDQFATEGTTVFDSQYLEWQIPGWIVSRVIDSVSVIEQSVGVLYSYDACIMPWESKLMAWENASSKDGILTYIKLVLISWDPGGLDPVIDAATGSNWNNTQLYYLHQTWDPGEYTQHRLEGKPNLKEGGLSTTCSRLVRMVGRYPWAGPARNQTRRSNENIYQEDTKERAGLELERNGGFGRGLDLAWSRHCSSSSYSSAFEIPLIIQFVA